MRISTLDRLVQSFEARSMYGCGREFGHFGGHAASFGLEDGATSAGLTLLVPFFDLERRHTQRAYGLCVTVCTLDRDFVCRECARPPCRHAVE